MRDRLSIRQIRAICAICAIGGSFSFETARAAEYRLLPASADVLPGSTISFALEVETEPGDNVVGQGYFSFAIDLTLLGTAGAVGSDISNVAINELNFDDTANNFHGHASGAQYLDIAGVTTDAFPPTFGQNVGDGVTLFTFDLHVPAAALMGSTIVITPVEGFLENLVANDTFDNVLPQVFQSAAVTVIPEPSVTVTLLALIVVAAQRRRSSRL